MTETHDEDQRAAMNATAGRLYFQAMVDAQGYPNGMPYWEEMKVADQYYHTLTGLQFLELLAKAGLLKEEAVAHLGVGDSVYGKGECLALVLELERRQPEEMKELQERIDAVRAAQGLPPEGGETVVGLEEESIIANHEPLHSDPGGGAGGGLGGSSTGDGGALRTGGDSDADSGSGSLRGGSPEVRGTDVPVPVPADPTRAGDAPAGGVTGGLSEQEHVKK